MGLKRNAGFGFDCQETPYRAALSGVEVSGAMYCAALRCAALSAVEVSGVEVSGVEVSEAEVPRGRVVSVRCCARVTCKERMGILGDPPGIFS